MFALLHDSFAGQPHHWTWVSHAVGCRAPGPLCRAAAHGALHCTWWLSACVHTAQALTGDRKKDGTYVGHVEASHSKLCAPVHNSWGYGMCYTLAVRRGCVGRVGSCTLQAAGPPETPHVACVRASRRAHSPRCSLVPPLASGLTACLCVCIWGPHLLLVHMCYWNRRAISDAVHQDY